MVKVNDFSKVTQNNKNASVDLYCIAFNSYQKGMYKSANENRQTATRLASKFPSALAVSNPSMDDGDHIIIYLPENNGELGHLSNDGTFWIFDQEKVARLEREFGIRFNGQVSFSKGAFVTCMNLPIEFNEGFHR